ncbi:MAG: AAA family ATPase, partial [Clostridia bacterium]
TETGVMDAVKNVLYHSRDISLFQDIQKNIENHDEFKALLVQILVEGIPASYNGLNPATDLGIIYGVLVPCDGKVMISNRIFETFIYNYLISVAPNRPVVEEYTIRMPKAHFR